MGVDVPWASIPALTRWAARRFGSAEALVDRDTRLSWTDLAADAGRAARAFVAAGIEAGDRVAVWAPNGRAWVAALLGLQSAGGVLVPLSTRFRRAEAADIVGRSRAKLLVTIGEFLGVDYPAMLDGADLPHLRRTVVIGGDEQDSWEAFLAAGDAIEAAEVDRRTDAIRADDPSDLMFTSGTTGAPKGVVSTHGQTLRVFATYAATIGIAEGDRYLIVNPMSHSFGYKAGVVTCLLAGATMLPVPVFDVDAVFDIVLRERVTVLPGPPTLYQSLLAHPRRPAADLSSLRLAMTGAAVIPTDLVRRMREELGIGTVITAYGLTESCGVVTACRPGDPDEIIANTSGRAIPGVEVRVVDDGGAEVPRGTPGEVLCRGFNVMPGYFEDPDATAEAIDTEGWLHTGDVGVMDTGGNVAITDRKGDMIIVGGFNAYPAEIENHLLAHPAVAHAAVVGVPDARLGEVPVAFVVPVPGADLTGEAVREWARGVMATYKAPRRVEVVEALPLNALGKVLRYELRERATLGG